MQSNLKCIQFLDRACDPNIDYVKSINTTTHPMIVAKKEMEQLFCQLVRMGMRKKEIQSLFPELFQGIGCVKTTYKIELNQEAVPVCHAPRRVPEAVKPEVKIELERLVSEAIIRPIEWPN